MPKSICRWATQIEQANNKRNSRHVTIGGVNATIAEHAREAGVPYKVLHKSVDAGWSPELLVNLLDIYRNRRAAAIGAAGQQENFIHDAPP